jgi:hypothetical protein
MPIPPDSQESLPRTGKGAGPRYRATGPKRGDALQLVLT